MCEPQPKPVPLVDGSAIVPEQNGDHHRGSKTQELAAPAIELTAHPCGPHCRRPRSSGRDARDDATCPACAPTISLSLPSENPLRSDRLPTAGPPSRLGPYKIVGLLGRGSVGTVYLAQDGELPRQVAIKTPRPEQFSCPEAADRFVEEARTIARLKHPGIVPLHHLGRDDEGTPFIVMDYMEGGSLAGLLESQRLTPVRIAGLMAEIAEAVHYAHQKGSSTAI